MHLIYQKPPKVSLGYTGENSEYPGYILILFSIKEYIGENSEYPGYILILCSIVGEKNVNNLFS
jgi:hypothetical protein